MFERLCFSIICKMKAVALLLNSPHADWGDTGSTSVLPYGDVKSSADNSQERILRTPTKQLCSAKLSSWSCSTPLYKVITYIYVEQREREMTLRPIS